MPRVNQRRGRLVMALTTVELQAIREAAERRALAPSVFARSTIMQALRDEPAEPPEPKAA